MDANALELSAEVLADTRTEILMRRGGNSGTCEEVAIIRCGEVTLERVGQSTCMTEWYIIGAMTAGFRRDIFREIRMCKPVHWSDILTTPKEK